MKILEQTFTQEPHSLLPETERPTLRLVLEDGGAGPYLVIHAAHWAIGHEDVIDRDKLVAAIDFMLSECKVQNEKLERE
jgi:hypothetical protein